MTWEVQRFPNGNKVITHHYTRVGQVKFLDGKWYKKKLVWIDTDPCKAGLHHFQILDAVGKSKAAWGTDSLCADAAGEGESDGQGAGALRLRQR